MVLRILAIILVMFAASTAFGPAEAATELKLLTSWGPNNVGPTYAVTTIIDEAKKLGGGALDIKRYGPEVVPPFEQLQPVSSGTFDLLFTHPAYHGGATAIGTLIDTIATDVEKRRSTGVFDWIDQYYQKNFQVKLIATPSQTGYQFILKEPLKDEEALRGRKIRSNPAYDPIVKALGGSPVLLPVPQIFTALQKGLVDGSAYTVNSLASQKLYEVVKYMARPTFGSGNFFFMVNLKKWQALDSAAQKALLGAGQKIEATLPWFSQRLEFEDEEQVIIHGGRYTYFDAGNAARLTQLFNEGLWAQAITKHGAVAEELVKLLKDKGMDNR